MEVAVLFGLCFFASGGIAVVTAAIVITVVLVRRLGSGGAASQGGAASGFGLGALSAWVARQNLVTGGAPARAIVLSISSVGTRTQFCGVRCDLRTAMLDIELPGTTPFVTQANVYIPTSLVRDTLPGSTMEVRIDPARRDRVFVVGPDVAYAQGAVRTA